MPPDIFFVGEKNQVRHRGIHVHFFVLFQLLHACIVNIMPLCISHCSHFSDSGRVLSVTLPASSSSYEVPGLRLGLRYRFSLQPNFASGLGGESSVVGRPGKTNTCSFICFCLRMHRLLTLTHTSVCSVCAWVSRCGVSGTCVH